MTNTNQKKESADEKQKSRCKKWRDNNKDRRRDYQKQWRERNAEKVADYQQQYHAEYRMKEDSQFSTWKRNLHRNYRITPDDFNSMWESQDGKCAICNENMVPRGRSSFAATVDHNHETGEVRGLLCRCCNSGIGNMKDSPSILIAAYNYLTNNGHYSKQ